MLALTLISSTGRAKIPSEHAMKLSSPDFRDGGNIPERFTCEGKDVSPTLTIDGVAKEAKSLVLIVDDPDAPAGNFTHWLMWNILPTLTEIVGNKPPLHAVQGVNDFGKSKYSGPCPPPGGVHRYYFRLYALDESVGLPPKSKRNVVDSAMKGSHYRRGDSDGQICKKRQQALMPRSAVLMHTNLKERYVKISLEELHLSWRWDRDELRLAAGRDGAYLLRTNLTESDPSKAGAQKWDPCLR